MTTDKSAESMWRNYVNKDKNSRAMFPTPVEFCDEELSLFWE